MKKIKLKKLSLDVVPQDLVTNVDFNYINFFNNLKFKIMSKELSKLIKATSNQESDGIDKDVEALSEELGEEVLGGANKNACVNYGCSC
jgi:hypothetical protein